MKNSSFPFVSLVILLFGSLFWRVLFLTGKYREGDENKIMPTPTAVCTNFCEAVDLICKNNDFVKNTGKTS